MQVGYAFEAGDWPLHITFVGVHDVDWKNPKLVEAYEHLMKNQKPITTKGLNIGNLGPENNPTKVTFMEMNDDVIYLHTKLVEFLETRDATFNNPEFNKAGFIAHSTVQKYGRVEEGQKVAINKLALIDMFPNKDASKRKIIKIIDLNQ